MYFSVPLQIEQILILAVSAFLAGFLDAVVGGGGLIQVPALLMTLPQIAIPTLFGSNKVASIIGTSFAVFQYRSYLQPVFFSVLPGAISAGIFSFLGAQTVKIVQPDILRPLIILLLAIVGIYTSINKNLGSHHQPKLNPQTQTIAVLIIGAVIGFYDGFFGPGTGSFFIFAFISILGFDFITASASAKILNWMTNFTAIIAFLSSGNVMWAIALPMAICNLAGAALGTRLAILKGNQFVRYLFMGIISLLILRLGYDLLVKK